MSLRKARLKEQKGESFPLALSERENIREERKREDR